MGLKKSSRGERKRRQLENPLQKLTFSKESGVEDYTWI